MSPGSSAARQSAPDALRLAVGAGHVARQSRCASVRSGCLDGLLQGDGDDAVPLVLVHPVRVVDLDAHGAGDDFR
jgi:hypothetical protein